MILGDPPVSLAVWVIFLPMRKLAFAAVLAGCFLGGCRWKGAESFLTATTPQEPIGGKGQWSGDPYAKSSVAEASGGTITTSNYGKGARTGTNAPLVPSYDQPAKGSGQQPGEFTVEAGPGYGKVNGPAMQASPSEAASLSTKGG